MWLRSRHPKRCRNTVPRPLPALLSLLVAVLATTGVTAAPRPSGYGQLGADLKDLQRFYHGPQNPQESNHCIDLWDGNKLHTIIRSAGLTNNHALFINSHGKALSFGANKFYAYYPHDKLLAHPQSVPHFSARDLAALLGPQADAIHNILVAGCDIDRAFDPAELRQYFVNATNITHAVRGQPGYQPMFLQAILSPARNIEPLYETPAASRSGATQYHISATPTPNAVKLSPYLAELYRPKARKPYRTQVAGRELLDPRCSPIELADAASPNAARIH